LGEKVGLMERLAKGVVHVRAMAEALGRTVPASRYSPDLSLHPMLGTQVKERDLSFLEDWKD
jgi:hypothetical protein